MLESGLVRVIQGWHYESTLRDDPTKPGPLKVLRPGVPVSVREDFSGHLS